MEQFGPIPKRDGAGTRHNERHQRRTVNSLGTNSKGSRGLAQKRESFFLVSQLTECPQKYRSLTGPKSRCSESLAL